jgi:hypothetical protein
MQRQDREYMHGLLGVEAAKIQGIFADSEVTWEVEEKDDVKIATGDVETSLRNWQDQLQQASISHDEIDENHQKIDVTMEAKVLPTSILQEQMIVKEGEGSKESTMKEMETIMATTVEELNDDQRRAYDIVDWHLKETVAGKKPPQLLMMIPGEGGVGKSKLIQTMSQNFQQQNVGEWLVKGAYTGIAASLIDGKTLHVLAGIPINGRKQSAQTLKKLHEFWHIKRYLMIDEVSMLSRSFFANMCRIITTAMEMEEEKPFGGLNVILVGDFHQFPPVVARRSAPLYWPTDSRHDSEDEILGRKIYEQFTMVVQLKKQIRVQDHEWHDILQHVRHGNCQQKHIDAIRQLIITNPDCPPTNYDTFPWKEARLVTPRHSVRNLWNAAAIRKYCAENHRRLYICPADDTIGGRAVTNEEKIAILTRRKGSTSRMDRGGLMKDVELAIGASVMVTLNILTDLDVANGVRGEIEDIVLDERDRHIAMKQTVECRLQNPPRYVLVKLFRTKAPCLEGLPPNVIPITPVSKTFSTMMNGTKITVKRTQLPLTLAYAFTDFRSQGQTINPLIVDIASPPYGYLTPFNIYVALSRATGRKNIRLLRDFDEKFLQQHPSEYLRLEDTRLCQLNELTKKIWETMNSHNVK